ncbi:hypothetical protein Tco_0753395 [Tanacetum coccineum]
MHMEAGKTWYGMPRDAAVAFVRYLSHCKSRQCTCLAVGRSLRGMKRSGGCQFPEIQMRAYRSKLFMYSWTKELSGSSTMFLGRDTGTPLHHVAKTDLEQTGKLPWPWWTSSAQMDPQPFSRMRKMQKMANIGWSGSANIYMNYRLHLI